MSISTKRKVLEYLLAHVGEVVTKNDLAQAAFPSTEWARRLRELRDEQGYRISSHNDRLDLKPGEYVLESAEPAKLATAREPIPSKIKREVLERDGYTCQQCGAGAGDLDPWNPPRRVRLHVDHEVPPEQGGQTEPPNLTTLCAHCNQNKGNLRGASESAVNLLARIRKAPREVRREVYEALRVKFKA